MRARCVVLGAASSVLLLLLAGCAQAKSGPQLPRYVVLSRHVSQGVHWQLDAYLGEEGLCLSVDGPDGPEGDTWWSSGACGFDSSPSGGYYTAGPRPGPDSGRTDIAYGPLPANATRVRTAAGKVVESHPFPAGRGLPSGRYWFAYEPVDPQPLDASGRPVAFTRF